MRRRQFITLLGGAVAWPVTARAQQAAMPVIGYLGLASPEAFAGRLGAFRLGLSEIGYVEGRNLAIEYRWAQNQSARLPALAADLVRRKVAVLAAPGGSAAVLAAKAATTTIPIVFETGVDPIALGIVASLNRPGGNVTGATSLNLEVTPKRLELLHELVPTATTIALLVDPTNPAAASVSRDSQAAARNLGVQLHVLHASTERDLDAVFATVVQLRAGGLVISAAIYGAGERLAALAVRHGLPTISQDNDFPAAGGLMSYGGSIRESHHQAGVYVGRILKGEKPADLPVQQVTKVELIVNLKTAKALGLTVPLALLTRADNVIE
jgi:putative tryptophan/tyrosine transport system substrate-binding protein